MGTSYIDAKKAVVFINMESLLRSYSNYKNYGNIDKEIEEKICKWLKYIKKKSKFDITFAVVNYSNSNISFKTFQKMLSNNDLNAIKAYSVSALYEDDIINFLEHYKDLKGKVQHIAIIRGKSWMDKKLKLDEYTVQMKTQWVLLEDFLEGITRGKANKVLSVLKKDFVLSDHKDARIPDNIRKSF